MLKPIVHGVCCGAHHDRFSTGALPFGPAYGRGYSLNAALAPPARSRSAPCVQALTLLLAAPGGHGGSATPDAAAQFSDEEGVIEHPKVWPSRAHHATLLVGRWCPLTIAALPADVASGGHHLAKA